MFQFLLSTFLTALVTPFFLKWAGDQIELQIDKMQVAVHSTPGVESPVPPVVVVGGTGLLVGHWLLARLLGLRFLGIVLGFVVGVSAGFGFYLYGTSRSPA